VRKEWASLVSTPSYAKFQDALAFTRSLGDFHLHTYGALNFRLNYLCYLIQGLIGVTHLPEINHIDLNVIFQSIDNFEHQTTKDDNTINARKDLLCLVMATDGVWDNWKYNDVGNFMMDSTCLDAVLQHEDGAQKVTMSFIHRNALYSRKNFGSQADNATCCILYIRRLK